MRLRRLFAKLIVGGTASLFVLQAVFPQPLPVAPNRPERIDPIPPVPVSSTDSGGNTAPNGMIHLVGTLAHEVAVNRATATSKTPTSSPNGQAFGTTSGGMIGVDPIEAGYPVFAAPELPSNGAKSAAVDPSPGPAAPPFRKIRGPAPATGHGSTSPDGAKGSVTPAGTDPSGSDTSGPDGASNPTVAADTGASRASKRANTASALVSSPPLLPKQGHAGPEVFSENIKMNNLIKRYMDIYTSPSGIDWLKLVLKRAEPFRDYIASRIQHYHMPPELLYLPIVESTYSPYAVSGSGAAGLWQFMTNSVYPYGLQINEWMDERFDFWKSTDASLEKLKYNYEQLGDWLLALAAYNVGLNYVQSVVRRTGIRNVWELGAKGYLPYETMVYIPKFLAIAAVCSYAGRYGLPVSWQTSTHWTRIKLNQAVDLRILAREAGVNESLLLEGNAELRYYITPPGDSNYYLKVPQRDSKVIEQVLKRQKFHLMRFYVYTVQSGDTLYDLSLYYGVPVSMILQYNPHASARYLQIGERLVIPGLKDVPPYTKAAAAKLSPQGPKITLHDPTGRFTGLYTVRPGDTLWGISQRFGITPAELAKVNGITESTIIHDGNVLHVPGPGALITQGAN